MRKTVHEWLETHDRGRQMAKKRRVEGGPGKAEGRPVVKTKKGAKQTARKQGKRRPR